MHDLTKIVGGATVAIVVVFVLMAAAMGLSSVRGQSDYAGQVVDVEYEKGMVLQTTQMKMKTNARSSTSETFCILVPENAEQVETAKTALANGDRVKVTYSRPLYVPITDCQAGTSIVQSIEVVEESD